MSYYFAIIGTKDNPLFEYEFGTSKQGGDGVARFREDARHMNQFIVHSSLDIVEEVQWTTGAMYLKSIDRFYTSHISCFLTPSNIKFLLLHNPDPNATPWQPSAQTGSSAATTSQPMSASAAAGSYPPPSAAASNRASTASTSSIAANPTSPATEEAVRQFFADVYENWVKTVMNPFYTVNQPVKSPVFRGRVAAAGRKYL